MSIELKGMYGRQSFQQAMAGQIRGEYFVLTDKSENETASRVKQFLLHDVDERYTDSPGQQAVITRHWETILDQACTNVGEDSSVVNNFLSVEKVRKISRELRHIIVAIEPEGHSPWELQEPHEEQTIRNVLKYLLHAVPFSQICSCDLVHQLTYRSDQEFTDELKNELQGLLHNLHARTSQPDGKNNLILEMMIGQVVALIAFLSCYKEGDLLEIPVKVEGEWKLVRYKTGLISLNPAWMGEEIQAVTWVPEKEEAPPLLVYKGSRGVVSWFTDFTPCLGVGEWLYNNARDKIDQFFTDFGKGRHKVQVHGISLGSALSYRTAQNYPDRVHLHAYAPPGVERAEESNVQGSSFMDPNDLVSLTGQFPHGDHHRVIKVIRSDTTCFPLTHARVYGGEETLLLRVNIAYENARIARQVMNFVHDLFAYPIALILGTIILLHGVYHLISQLFHSCVYAQDAAHENIVIS